MLMSIPLMGWSDNVCWGVSAKYLYFAGNFAHSKKIQHYELMVGVFDLTLFSLWADFFAFVFDYY